MDDDNVLLPEALSILVQAALASGADVLTCPMNLFTGNKVPRTVERVWVPLGGAAGAGVYRNVFGDANALWKKSAFLQLGGFTTDYGVGHEDWELFAEAVLRGLRLELVPKPLYWYRVNENGMLLSGDQWADHARSVRPYLRHDTQGIGLALAYGLFMDRQRAIGAQAPRRETGGWRVPFRVLHLAKDPTLRVRFIGVAKSQGLRSAVRRAFKRAEKD